MAESQAVLITHGHQVITPISASSWVAQSAGQYRIDDATMLSIEAGPAGGRPAEFSVGPHVQAIHTRSTPGSACFLALRTHLFAATRCSPRPRQYQKDPVRFERIISSIRERLFNLPDATAVYPGHGRDTTIGQERPHLPEWIARGW